MIDFSRLTGLTTPRGVVTQIADASGRVIWSGRKLIAGSLTLRPSADISVEHTLYPSDSTAAYLLINEEVADDSSTYIVSGVSGGSPTSKFKLNDIAQLPGNGFTVTSVNIVGKTYSPGVVNTGISKNDFKLEINGIETSTTPYIEGGKAEFDFSISDAVWMINEAVAKTGMLPNINVSITSYAVAYTDSNGKEQMVQSGVTQVCVVLGYECY